MKKPLSWGLLALALFAVSFRSASGRPTVQVADTTQIEASVDSTVVAESAAIAARLRLIYGSLDAFSGIEVGVTAYVVHLTGKVADTKTLQGAEALASSISGVVFVVNDLEVDVAVETRVSPALQRLKSYTEGAIAYLPIIGLALIVLLTFSLLARWSSRLDKPLARLGLAPMLRMLIGRVIASVIFLIGLILALDILDLTTLVGTVIAAAGVVGIAIGFAFQDIVENYLAGILLSIRRPFSLNDHLKIGDVEGKVLRLTSRELLLMTLDGNHVRLSNATVYKATIYNYTRNPRRRFDFEVGVGVDEDLVVVQELGLATLSAIPGVMADPAPAMIVAALGDSNVVVRFFAWVDQEKADFGKVRSTAIRLVKTTMDEAGIAMPEPAYILKVTQMESAATEGGGQPKSAQESGTSPIAVAENVIEQARRADVSVDTELARQMQEDATESDEQNLLSNEKP